VKFPKSLLLAFLFLAGCATEQKQTLSRFEFEQPQMGVPFRIVLYAPSETAAQAAAEKAMARVAQLNAIMSDYEYDSELSKLGRTSGSGQKVRVSDELWIVLKRSQEIAKASDGAFDITIAPLIQLWRKARREKVMPSAEAIAKAKFRVGYTNLVLKDHIAELKRPDMRLDLGGIAKGYAADEALKVLRTQGFTRAMTAASSDIALGDPPPGEKGWKVQLLDTKGPTNTLILHNCGVSTSGDLFQFVEIGGKRYSHIVDPKTGLGLTDRSLVTIIAKDAFTSDSLETTISVMGPERGLKLAEKFGADCRAIRNLEGPDRAEFATPGFWKRAK
jgi:thiamine biosynthesis lipoprotein